MSEGFDVYCGLLRMYDGFSATPAFRGSSTTTPTTAWRSCADATGSTAWPETAARSVR